MIGYVLRIKEQHTKKSNGISAFFRNENSFSKALGCLDAGQKRKIVRLAFIQSCLNILDILAVGIIGIVGSLTVYGVQSRSSSETLTTVLRFIQLEGISFQLQVALLATIATLLFLTKSALSYIVNSKTLLYLSELSGELSRDVLSKLTFSNIKDINSASTQEKLYSITMGTYYLMIGIIAPFGVILSDLVLMLLLFVILMLANSLLAISLLILFGLVGFIIYKKLSNTSFSIGAKLAKLEVESNIQILEGFKFSRDLALRNSKSSHIDKVAMVRKRIALYQGKLSLLPIITKYVIETAIVIAALIVAAIQFIFLDASGAFASLALFLAAGSRIAPAALRVQHSLMTVKLSAPGAMKAINLLKAQNSSTLGEPSLSGSSNSSEIVIDSESSRSIFVEFTEVSLLEVEDNRKILSNVNFISDPNSITVIIGPTGAGKSTILDLAIGVLEPSQGSIRISKLSPPEFIENYPNSVRYVPQNVEILNATLLENILFRSVAEFSDKQRLLEVLEVTKLNSVVDNLPNGIHTVIGDGGHVLSGGEIQRIGIARAIFDQPKLLLLDEVTSSLDRETEDSILKMIKKLSREMTIIMIAHRISNMQIADQIIYIKDGCLIEKGSVTFVRDRHPDLFA